MPEFRQTTARTSQPIGLRDRPVRIEARASSDAVDDTGFPIDDSDSPGDWKTLAEVEWMARYDIGARERMMAHQLSAPFDSQWSLSYRADMDPDRVDVAKLRRLVYLNRVYDIVGGSVIGHNHSIDLLTLARTG